MKYKLLLLIFVLTSCVTTKSYYGKMDSYEQQMLKEYDYHNIEALFKYVKTHELQNRTKVSVGGREYKVRVRRNSKWAEYDDSVTIIFKIDKFEYIFYKKRTSLSFYSPNMSFSIIYKKSADEYKFVSNRTSFASHEFKVYGYVYAYIDDNMVKIEDWVVRDAIGRANSIIKPRK